MQHEHHRVPVTALAFWTEHVILAGEGSQLRAYNVNQKSLLTTKHVFDGQSIHGIVIEEHDDNIALIWGGRYLCCARLKWNTIGDLEVNLGPIRKADDWILDASLQTRDNRDTAVALVTAHNALQVARLDGDVGELQTAVPGSNCILYCAHVQWLSDSQCLIASGTAFGDVIVWSCAMTEVEGKLSAEHQNHYTFSAHEGSVFGVQLSYSYEAGNLAGFQRILSTCSDDRTVRLWDISDLTVRSPTFMEQQRQTGFGSTDSDAHAPLLLAKAMGHISRIWHVRLKQCDSTGDVCVLSFGEDASLITWAVQEGSGQANEPPYRLDQTACLRPHSGKHIWSLAIRGSTIATGGADGAISLQELSCPAQRQDLILGLNNGSIGEKETGVFRSYGFVDDSQILASTDKGALFMVTLSRGLPLFVKIADAFASLRGYSIMVTLPGFAFIAGSDGQVHLYEHKSRTVSIITESGRKVAGLFVQRLSHSRLALLVTNMGRDYAMLYELRTTDESLVLSNIDVRHLSLPDRLVVTSFAVWGSNEGALVFLGSRSGSISGFDLSHKGNSDGLVLPRTSISIHVRETVTSLQVISGDGDPHRMHLLSTGRDGTYAILQIEATDGQLRITTVHQLSLPLGPNIEGAGFNAQHQLWIWGFRSTNFVVFDVQTQQEVMAVECGGAHRIWTYQPMSGGGMFVWTKASRLNFECQSELPFRLFNAGGHGREIKSTAVSPASPQLIATGAEDTNIKLHVYECEAFKCMHTLQKHNTGIQHLRWSEDGGKLFSSGGFEELFVWKVSPNVPIVGVGVLCESAHPRSGSSDLRIMHFDVYRAPDAGFRITTVYSDSSIVSWHYNQAWTSLSAASYLTSCLTHCIGLPSLELTLTASTDGHMAVWKHDQLRWTTRHKVHQNAVLAMESCPLTHSDADTLFITGGDDNALAFTLGVESFSTVIIPRAHAAAVTALCAIPHETTKSVWLVVSASLDQRVKLWRVEVVPDRHGVQGINVRLIQQSPSAVADVSSVGRLRSDNHKRRVLICGVGMEVWDIDEEVISKR